MSLLSENIIPGNHGKIFGTNANTVEDLERIKNEILTLEGISEVILNNDIFPKEFTIYTTKLIEVEAVEEKVNNVGFNAIPKSLFAL
ncbi:heavy-metal-associated domain-containing protein [Flavobacterium sp. TMP13]|uniref:hypothetical protein n=1 Tax=unclassified Flavobacterium TaxID=196869 RepID=UPI00076C570E|nr:hypothetical protein [Flavobacterium sp. TAB 87]KVV15490.1 hypothetical protein AP058_01159 [Flavobacterium sp. TAB 87]